MATPQKIVLFHLDKENPDFSASISANVLYSNCSKIGVIKMKEGTLLKVVVLYGKRSLLFSSTYAPLNKLKNFTDFNVGLVLHVQKVKLTLRIV